MILRVTREGEYAPVAYIMVSGFTYGEDGDWDMSGVKFLGSDVRWFSTFKF
jgi:hypothetical protein